jgi:hypothetical protein
LTQSRERHDSYRLGTLETSPSRPSLHMRKYRAAADGKASAELNIGPVMIFSSPALRIVKGKRRKSWPFR